MKNKPLLLCKLCNSPAKWKNPYWFCSNSACAMWKTFLKESEWNLLMESNPEPAKCEHEWSTSPRDVPWRYCVKCLAEEPQEPVKGLDKKELIKVLYLYEDHMCGHPGVISENHFEDLAKEICSTFSPKANTHICDRCKCDLRDFMLCPNCMPKAKLPSIEELEEVIFNIADNSSVDMPGLRIGVCHKLAKLILIYLEGR